MLALSLLAACRGGAESPGYAPVVGGDAQRGQEAIQRRNCGVCHQIPGVIGGHGVIGPSLDGLERRSYIAGALPNTPNNLVRWIREPRALRPRTVMPNLGIEDVEARDIAAYLYRLR
jgi:cytochrome c